jgi:uncharacterized protein (DUF2249 family)
MTAVMPPDTDPGQTVPDPGQGPDRRPRRKEMQMSSSAVDSCTVDIRALGGCVERKARVLKTFDSLVTGESVVVVNDHLPNGLLRHFEEQRPGGFEWALLEDGPEVFRVRITRRGTGATA